MKGIARAYLGNAADVLLAVLGREAKVLVQAESYVVAVESVGCQAMLEEVLLKGNCNGGFSGSGETGEPDGNALLLAKIAALGARQAVVPSDVPGRFALTIASLGADSSAAGLRRKNA